MPEEEPGQGQDNSGPPTPAPELPPFNPDFELIGYVERGQQWPGEERAADDQEDAVPLPLPEADQER